MNTRAAALLLAGLLGSTQSSVAQSATPQPHYFRPYTVPSAIRHLALALGPRVQDPGRERIVFTGTLTRDGATTSLRIIRQLPGLARIDETGGRGQTLVFDLTRLAGRGAIDDNDEDLAESLEMDSAEQFLNNIGPAATLRLLGQRFHVRGSFGFGAEVDVFEMVLPVKSRRDKETRIKRFMFDSRTGLLSRVAYDTRKGSQVLRIQTVLSDYSQGDGHALPGRIERTVNGITMLVLVRQSAAIMAAVNDNAFQIPQ